MATAIAIAHFCPKTGLTLSCHKRNPFLSHHLHFSSASLSHAVFSRERGEVNLTRTHRRRMGSKKKLLFKIIRLVSAAGTRFFYAKKKSRKIDLKKYDPKLKYHVLFTEAS
ncbi:hypothetical protein Ahy_A08g041283 [Arachis hypogaea]|uniref:50S ribosomal protein L33, chloroplastic n=1 Tax=Arachis hypogaea TaxID=3818 RepID=A0A445C281_ARAHY|nr:hypothetical protein Ahy_A08g041283 [Arachis hypogaea]